MHSRSAARTMWKWTNERLIICNESCCAVWHMLGRTMSMISFVRFGSVCVVCKNVYVCQQLLAALSLSLAPFCIPQMVSIAVENIIGIDCTSKLFLSDRTVQLVMRARVPRTALSRSLSQFQLEWQFTRTLAVWYTYFTICYLFRFNVCLICWFLTRAVCYFILFRIHRYLFRLLRSCTHTAGYTEIITCNELFATVK